MSTAMSNSPSPPRIAALPMRGRRRPSRRAPSGVNSPACRRQAPESCVSENARRSWWIDALSLELSGAEGPWVSGEPQPATRVASRVGSVRRRAVHRRFWPPEMVGWSSFSVRLRRVLRTRGVFAPTMLSRQLRRCPSSLFSLRRRPSVASMTNPSNATNLANPRQNHRSSLWDRAWSRTPCACPRGALSWSAVEGSWRLP